jgi:phenylpropionate dioxygenase-like ring-hydroxylating dioxygenase large terminal subunit
MTASAADGGIAGLVAEQSAGHPLAQVFYSDPEIFRRDLDRMVLRRWLCAGHVSSVPNVGDFFLLEIAMESAIIVRG